MTASSSPTAFPRRWVLLVATLLFAHGAGAQEIALRVGTNVLVGREPAGTQLIEPHIAAHPTDPTRLLAVGWVHPATAERSGTDDGHCATFVSSDGGATWSRTDVASVWCADPWVTLTEHGAVLTAIGKHPSLPDTEVQLLAYFSSDGGRTWNDVPQSLGRGHDGPRTIAAPDGTIYVVSGGAGRNRAGYFRFRVFLGRARPGSPHIEPVTLIQPSNLNLNSEGMAVLADGTLVVAYHDFQRNVQGFRSRDGALEGRRTWAVVSDDRGEDFSVPLFVNETCYARPTDFAADTSDGPYADRLYHVCPGDDLQSILLTWSADRGEEWSAPTPISPSDWRPSSRFPIRIGVNRDGVVAVAWMDRRDDPSAGCYAPYLSVSADGGATFGAPVRVADEPSCPDPAGAGAALSRFPTGGDYFGLVAAPDGRFHVLWPDARDGRFALMTATVSTVGGETTLAGGSR